MNAMRDAMLKSGAGFEGYPEGRSAAAKKDWLRLNGLRTVSPIKQVRLHLGAIFTKGGLVILDEVFVTRTEER
jgi:hypothetical protein